MNKYNKTERDSENKPVVATIEETLWEVGVQIWAKQVKWIQRIKFKDIQQKKMYWGNKKKKDNDTKKFTDIK